MTIPNKTLEKWKALKEEGDISKLAALIGKSEQVVYQILRTGDAKIGDAEKINDFYKKRIRRASKIK